jgi:hypothetical protein
MALLEQQSELGHIDLFYGDETGLSELAYLPYGWQQKGERVAIPAAHGNAIELPWYFCQERINFSQKQVQIP